jgi:hypothetical protein
LQKIQDWGSISLVAILFLAILPELSFGQIPTLDKLELESSSHPECLDFNQDTICEFILLANGTMTKNPTIQTAQQQEKPITEPTISKPLEGKCLGFQNNYCRNLLLADGSVVPNPNFVDTFVASGPSAGSTEPGHSTQAVQTESNDNNNDNNNNDEESKTYCDVPNPSNPCHDRRDVSEATGVYTCMDGSHEADWRDCNGGGSDNDDDNDGRSDDWDEPRELEDGESIEVGEATQGYEDEEGTIDE